MSDLDIRPVSPALGAEIYGLDVTTLDDAGVAAVRQAGSALQYVANQTEELCLAAIAQNPYAFYWVREQTEAICIAALRADTWLPWERVRVRTPAVLAALAGS